jgi:hypothetical protein
MLRHLGCPEILVEVLYSQLNPNAKVILIIITMLYCGIGSGMGLDAHRLWLRCSFLRSEY